MGESDDEIEADMDDYDDIDDDSQFTQDDASADQEKRWVVCYYNQTTSSVHYKLHEIHSYFPPIRKIRITDCPFGFAFSHLSKPLFSKWATFLPRKMMTS